MYKMDQISLCTCTSDQSCQLAESVMIQVAIQLASIEFAEQIAMMHWPINAVVSHKIFHSFFESTCDLLV